jgi:PAS domain-containing protein
MAHSNLQYWMARSSVLRYGLSLVSFSGGLGGALLAQRFQFHNVELPVMLFPVALSAWYAGRGPAIVSLVVSIAAFDFFFTEPHYSFEVDLTDLPYLIVFICFASLVIGFSSVRKRVESELREARDRLEAEVEERTRQASLLDLTHDSIFVRDPGDLITYWNRGAEELYGWTPAEAIGKVSHELLHTVLSSIGSSRCLPHGVPRTVDGGWTIQYDNDAWPCKS